MNRTRQLLTIFWVTVLIIFGARGATSFLKELREGRVGNPSPNASSDRLLQPLLKVTHPTNRLSAMLEALPQHDRLLFVSTKGAADCDFIYSMVCYLGWPRKVDRIELMSGENGPLSSPADKAVIFCGISPGPIQGGRHALGPNLVLVTPDSLP